MSKSIRTTDDKPSIKNTSDPVTINQIGENRTIKKPVSDTPDPKPSIRKNLCKKCNALLPVTINNVVECPNCGTQNAIR